MIGHESDKLPDSTFNNETEKERKFNDLDYFQRLPLNNNFFSVQDIKISKLQIDDLRPVK